MTKYFLEISSGKLTVIIADRIEFLPKQFTGGTDKCWIQFFIGNDIIAEFQDWVGYQIDYGPVYNKGTFEE